MQYEVSPEGLRGHGSQVTAYENRVNQIADAAETTVTNDAFGLMNAWMTATVGLIARGTEGSIDDQAEDLGETAASLRTMAKNNETTDANASSTVSQAGGAR